MAERIVSGDPTVHEKLRCVLMRLIRAQARDAYLKASDPQAKAVFAKIAQLADDGAHIPLDGRARLLCEHLEQEMARFTGVLDRAEGMPAMI